MSGPGTAPLPGTPACPLLTAALPGLGGHIGPAPEDFRVWELPAYPASGEGPHFFIEVEKRGLSTGFVREALARAAGVKAMDVGCAGRKDTQAITTQWFSLPVSPVLPAELGPAVRFIGEPVRHGNKLRMGHLRGNRFEVRLLGIDPAAEARWPALRDALAGGFPNAFGEQRFGRNSRNLPEALDFLENPRRRVRDPEFLASVAQSAAFNAWLGARVAAGGLHRAMSGDVLRKRLTGGLFVCDDPASDTPRVEAGEVDPTGPMPGAKTFSAAGEAAEAEQKALEILGLSETGLATLRRFAPGTRRAARVVPEGLGVGFEGQDAATLTFTLPAGSFATVLLAELCHPDGPLRPDAALEDAGS